MSNLVDGLHNGLASQGAAALHAAAAIPQGLRRARNGRGTTQLSSEFARASYVPHVPQQFPAGYAAGPSRMLLMGGRWPAVLSAASMGGRGA